MTRKSKISVVVCFCMFLMIYGITSRANLQLSDEAAVFASGISLATRGTLDIDSLRWLQEQVNVGHDGRDGHLYTKYFPGNVLGTALIYSIAQRPNDTPYFNDGYAPNPSPHLFAPSNFGARLALRLNAVLGAMGVTALYFILLRRFDWKTASVTILLFGLCTHWWYESRGLFSEIGAGTFMILSLGFADLASPALSGISLGVSLLFRPTNLIGIPVWLYGVWRKGLKSIWTGVFILTGFCVLLTYNWLRFNSVLDFGYVDEGFNGSIVEGLTGVLFSPGRSLFFYSPVLILCISGGKALYRSDKPFAGAILTAIAGYLISTAMWHAWDGGTSWGSRLMTPVLPLLAILLAPMVEKALSVESKHIRFYMILLAALGVGIQLLTLSANTLQVLIHYAAIGYASYGESIYSFHKSWLSLQIRYLENWTICNVDSYTIKQLLQCK